MKNKYLKLLLITSLAYNFYLVGKWVLVDVWYTPNDEEKIILGEMVQKTIESKQFKDISDKEKVISIETYIDKNKGGSYPFYFSVHVVTDLNTYIFDCSDKKCNSVDTGGTMYSRYEDESPRLPLELIDDKE